MLSFAPIGLQSAEIRLARGGIRFSVNEAKRSVEMTFNNFGTTQRILIAVGKEQIVSLEEDLFWVSEPESQVQTVPFQALKRTNFWIVFSKLPGGNWIRETLKLSLEEGAIAARMVKGHNVAIPGDVKCSLKDVFISPDLLGFKLYDLIPDGKGELKSFPCNVSEVPAVYMNQANRHAVKGDYAKASKLYNKAHSIADAISLRMDWSSAIMLNLGTFEWLRGNRRQAFANWREANKHNVILGGLATRLCLLYRRKAEAFLTELAPSLYEAQVSGVSSSLVEKSPRRSVISSAVALNLGEALPGLADPLNITCEKTDIWIFVRDNKTKGLTGVCIDPKGSRKAECRLDYTERIDYVSIHSDVIYMVDKKGMLISGFTKAGNPVFKTNLPSKSEELIDVFFGREAVWLLAQKGKNLIVYAVGMRTGDLKKCWKIPLKEKAKPLALLFAASDLIEIMFEDELDFSQAGSLIEGFASKYGSKFRLSTGSTAELYMKQVMAVSKRKKVKALSVQRHWKKPDKSLEITNKVIRYLSGESILSSGDMVLKSSISTYQGSVWLSLKDQSSGNNLLCLMYGKHNPVAWIPQFRTNNSDTLIACSNKILVSYENDSKSCHVYSYIGDSRNWKMQSDYGKQKKNRALPAFDEVTKKFRSGRFDIQLPKTTLSAVAGYQGDWVAACIPVKGNSVEVVFFNQSGKEVSRSKLPGEYPETHWIKAKLYAAGMNSVVVSVSSRSRSYLAGDPLGPLRAYRVTNSGSIDRLPDKVIVGCTFSSDDDSFILLHQGQKQGQYDMKLYKADGTLEKSVSFMSYPLVLGLTSTEVVYMTGNKPLTIER
jgi:hypothetical protein